MGIHIWLHLMDTSTLLMAKESLLWLNMWDRIFTLQARMVEAENSNGLPVRATVFSAVVAKQHNSDIVEFQRSRRGLDALVNGVMVDFENLPKQDFNNVTLSDLGNQTLSALFLSGAYVQAKLENGIISVLLVSLPDSFYNATYGTDGHVQQGYD